MDLAGQYNIPAKKEIVWNALNNPNILKKSIKGCESLEKSSENEFNAKVKANIGPVSATFIGSVKISDVTIPNGYTLSGEGKGGVAGFAKGSVKITLSNSEQPNHTTLDYSGSAQVGGKLAQLGSRLIGGVIKKTTDEFFENFCVLVKNDSTVDNNSTGAIEEDVNVKKDYSIPYWAWISGLILLILISTIIIN